MTLLRFGTVITLTICASVDHPAGFSSSKLIGPCFGRTPQLRQSDEIDRTAVIRRADGELRSAQNSTCHDEPCTKTVEHKSPGNAYAKRRGAKRAKVAPGSESRCHPAPDVGR